MTPERKTYQGRPCKWGHPGVRYRTSRQCTDCLREHQQNEGPARVERYRARHRDAINEKARNCRATSGDSINARARAERAVDPHKRRLIVRRSRQKDPERTRDWCRKSNVARRSRMAQPDSHTADDRALIFELQNGGCFYCDVPLAYGDAHGDHFIALARDGSDARHNIVMACALCNLQKGAEGPVMFAFRKGTDPNKRPVFWGERGAE